MDKSYFENIKKISNREIEKQKHNRLIDFLIKNIFNIINSIITLLSLIVALLALLKQ